jgi:hypothetical protein
MELAQGFGISIGRHCDTPARPQWKFVLARFVAGYRFVESRAKC